MKVENRGGRRFIEPKLAQFACKKCEEPTTRAWTTAIPTFCVSCASINRQRRKVENYIAVRRRAGYEVHI